MTYIFTIPGAPQGKGRPRFGRLKNGRVHTYTPDKTAKYEDFVKQCWLNAGGRTVTASPVAVEINAYFPIPKSYSRMRVQEIIASGEPPAKKPDCDNIIKIILDALNETAYTDDKQVVDVRCRKHYAAPGEDGRTEVVLWTV